MGRQAKSRRLGVWMNGQLVGYWTRPAAGPQEFAYVQSWLESTEVRPISLALPLRPAGIPHQQGVEDFFDNLLPDNTAIRERIQIRFRTASLRAFDLLQEIGRDCVGALQFLPPEETPRGIYRIEGVPLSTHEISVALQRSSGRHRFGSEDSNDFRISLAGAQEKTAFLYHQNRWQRPLNSTPTTHIFKLPLGQAPGVIDLTTSVENEWLCLKILLAFGIPAAAATMESFEGQKVLIVERFDRSLTDKKYYIRLPQEDLAQATGTPSHAKYENEGGPGILRIMDQLRTSVEPFDRADFMRTQVLFWMLAAIDGHAKNFSIFIQVGGRFRLTPNYDVLSAFPVMGHGKKLLSPHKIKMAMAVIGKNRHYRWKDINPSHWIQTGKKAGFNGMEAILHDLATKTDSAVGKLKIPRDFPVHISQTILDGLTKSARILARG